MKEFVLEASVRFPAADSADAAEKMAAYFTAIAAIHRGHGSADALDLADWVPGSECTLRPLNANGGSH